jgi:molybdopterin converting factor small subunit
VIIVRLPAMLGGGTVAIDRQVRTLEELTSALCERRPDLSARLNDTIFNFAVNDELVLHGARNHALRDGDSVEIVPAISGG